MFVRKLGLLSSDNVNLFLEEQSTPNQNGKFLPEVRFAIPLKNILIQH